MDKKLQQHLLTLARNVLENELTDHDHDLRKHKYPAFTQKRGLFVTLSLKGDLRGCIGQIEPIDSIYTSVIRLAKSSAFEDHRFNPLTSRELPQTTIEISLLTEPEEIEGSDNHDKMVQIRPHIDGVILRAGGCKSTFLPQVWESIATTESFISELCRKAGLPKDYWEDNPIDLQVYQVEHFEETTE